MRASPLLIAAGAAVLLLGLYPATASAMATPSPAPDAGDGALAAGDETAADDTWSPLALWGAPAIELAPVRQALDSDPGGNVAAFLAMISHSEGTDRRADPYRVCYGYAHTIADLSDHPAVTGEWRGESLDSLGPKYSGQVSTAAGRYQIIKPTWVSCKRALGLRDFSPASQDAAAVHLVRQRFALADVQSGRIEAAIAKCRREWASLPGAGYGQPERQLAELLDTFTAAGGLLA